MIVPSKNQKTYGVLHTENYFSFLGFCKKVNSDEIQKVDIYLDDVLIDTIIADKHLQKIEDIYELDGFGFNYDLPEEYIGQKSLISFKNHETQENLQNSPYGLIRENHPKFNEALFLNSLEQDSNKEEIREMYSANSIGFLATEENLNDTSFIEYIKELIVEFPDIKFIGYCFSLKEKSLYENLFLDINNIQFLIINNYKLLISQIELYINNVNSENYLSSKIKQILLYLLDNITVINFNSKIFNLTLEEHSLDIMKPGFPYYDNPYYFGFNDEDIKLSQGNLHKLIFSKMPKNKSFEFNTSKTLKENSIDHIRITFNNKELKDYGNMLHLKFKEFLEQKND